MPCPSRPAAILAAVAASVLLVGGARAGDGVASVRLPAAPGGDADAAPVAAPVAALGEGPVAAWFADWDRRAAAARARQPEWSSPVVTTTALLEQRARFDTSFQQAGNRSDTISLDGGKGLDLIVSPTQEIQVAVDPYVIRTTASGKGQVTGFNDWPVVRFKQRLASSPRGAGDYVVSAWLQAQAPTGVAALSSRAFTLLPTLGFGKGVGRFVAQGTVGAVVPTAHEGRLGTQLTANVALQCQVLRVLWPQIEVNWTRYLDGLRGGKNQVFLTPGLVIGRLPITRRLRFTFGVGYQAALAPRYRPSPLLPAYNHAWIITTRMSF